MKNRLTEYLIRLLGSLLIVIFILMVMDKIGLEMRLLNIGILIKAVFLVGLVWIFFKLKSLSFKPILVIVERFSNKIVLLFPRRLVSWVLVAIFLFILSDIFSIKQTNDITILALVGLWLLASRFYRLEGRVSIGVGLFFLALCPFLLIFGKEIFAQKAAVWAYMFLVAGVIQELWLPLEAKSDFGERISLSDFLPRVQRAYTLLVGRVSDFRPKPFIVRREKREAVEMKVSDLEVYKIAREINKVTWEIYKSLSEQEKKILGNQYLKLADFIGADIIEGYGRFRDLEKIEFYYKARDSLLKLQYQTELMEERKIGDPKLLGRLKKLVAKEEKKLNTLIDSYNV